MSTGSASAAVVAAALLGACSDAAPQREATTASTTANPSALPSLPERGRELPIVTGPVRELPPTTPPPPTTRLSTTTTTSSSTTTSTTTTTTTSSTTSTSTVPPTTMPASPPPPARIDIELGYLFFGPNSSELSPDAVDTVRLAVDARGDCEIEGAAAVGHTDTRNTEAYNLGLSIDRAEAVEQMLIEHLFVADAAIDTSGAGESEPVVDDHPAGTFDEELGRQNRRVELALFLRCTEEAR